MRRHSMRRSRSMQNIEEETDPDSAKWSPRLNVFSKKGVSTISGPISHSSRPKSVGSREEIRNARRVTFDLPLAKKVSSVVSSLLKVKKAAGKEKKLLPASYFEDPKTEKRNRMKLKFALERAKKLSLEVADMMDASHAEQMSRCVQCDGLTPNPCIFCSHCGMRQPTNDDDEATNSDQLSEASADASGSFSTVLNIDSLMVDELSQELVVSSSCEEDINTEVLIAELLGPQESIQLDTTPSNKQRTRSADAGK